MIVHPHIKAPPFIHSTQSERRNTTKNHDTSNLDNKAATKKPNVLRPRRLHRETVEPEPERIARITPMLVVDATH